MSKSCVVDLVLCLDASSSMASCIDGVREHLSSFVEGLHWDAQQREIDLRVGVVAHSCLDKFRGIPYGLYDQQSSHRLFTADLSQVRRQLQEVVVDGNEASLIALDTALDFPWRPRSECHRVIIMMTDEPFESGIGPGVWGDLEKQRQCIPALTRKLYDLGVMLFLVAPASAAFEEISSAPKTTYKVVDANNGLSSVSFSEVLALFGKTVSASTLQNTVEKQVQRALFGQDRMGG